MPYFLVFPLLKQNKPKNKIYPAIEIQDKVKSNDCQANKAKFFNMQTAFILIRTRITLLFLKDKSKIPSSTE
jgi:hypothetical protein